MKFHLNKTEYWIDKDLDGFFWASRCAESNSAFPTALEAQQDAIKHAKQEIEAAEQEIEAAEQELADALEDELYGTYEQQVNNLYYSTRL